MLRRDPYPNDRLVGHVQSHSVGHHTHQRALEHSGFQGGGAAMQVFRPGGEYKNEARISSLGPLPKSDETRPINVAVNFIIKY